MSFPLNPTNGQQATVDGVIYTYVTPPGVWNVGSAGANSVSGNTLAITGNASVGGSLSTVNLTVTGTTSLSAGALSVNSLTTGNTVSATGNVTGGNINTGGLVSATGNVRGGNLISTGIISATGNITGGNLAATNTTTANISVTSRIVGGVNTFTKTVNLGNGDIILDNGTTDTPGIHFYYGNSVNFGIDVASSALRFVRHLGEANGVVIGSMDTSGNYTSAGSMSPGTNNAVDLGSASFRWRNIYTNDLQLSNGIGDYTVVEGEEDLFLYNNKSGKTFKFALIEVDPSTVPPKAKTE